MPWSEWIQPPDVDVTPFKRLLAYPQDLFSFTDPTEWWIGSGVSWNAVQFRAAYQPNPAFPSDLYPLVEGVDYEAIPGSDPSDPARFAQYENPTPAWLRWEWLNGGPLIYLKLGTPGGGSARILAGTTYPDVDEEPFTPGYQGPGIPPPPPNAPPGGTTFATFTGSEPDGTALTSPPNVGPCEAFTITTEFTVESATDDRIYFRTGDPVAFYRPARWRYWIPGGAPLRLIQRGDGLGMGSGRVLGTGTRQSSTRLLGAL